MQLIQSQSALLLYTSMCKLYTNTIIKNCKKPGTYLKQVLRYSKHSVTDVKYPIITTYHNIGVLEFISNQVTSNRGWPHYYLPKSLQLPLEHQDEDLHTLILELDKNCPNQYVHFYTVKCGTLTLLLLLLSLAIGNVYLWL